MIIEKIVSTLPSGFYLVVLASSFIYLVWMTVQLILTRISVRHLQYDLYAIEDSIRLHQGCHIENLPLISEIFETTTRKLSYAYEKMIQMSIDFYQKKWIPDPNDFITINTILDKRTAKKIKGYGFLYFTFTGLALSLIFVLFGIIFFKTNEQISACLVMSLLPLPICLLFTILLYVEKLQNKTILENSILSLNQTLSRKLPVFNDYNGLALLINQFSDYDRNMTKAVEKLTEQIDNMVMDGLTKAVTESIERTLIESVAPSIERATSAIVTLSYDVIEKENTGMKDLALKFSTALSDELAYQLSPLINQICEVANTLSNSKNYLDIASKTLDTYKQNAIELQTLTSKTLLDYESSKAMFSRDIHDIAASFEQFNQASSEYNEKVDSNQQRFEKAAITLKESIESGHDSLRQLLDGIFIEARNAENQADTAQKMNENYLNIMKTQIDSLSHEFSSTNKSLIEGLSSTISGFISQQAINITSQQDKVETQSLQMLQSMEKAAKEIQSSSSQIKSAFDELEAARRIEEENARNRKPGFFSRKT